MPIFNVDISSDKMEKSLECIKNANTNAVVIFAVELCQIDRINNDLLMTVYSLKFVC